jgi:hypothetical protein
MEVSWRQEGELTNYRSEMGRATSSMRRLKGKDKPPPTVCFYLFFLCVIVDDRELGW